MRWLVAGGALVAAAVLLNLALARSSKAQAYQRTLAVRLRTSLDSLSQRVGVFVADRRLTNWNHCFQSLLDAPKAMVRPGTPYDAFAEHTAEHGDFLESSAQIRHRRSRPGEPLTYVRKLRDEHQMELRRTGTPDGGFVLTIELANKVLDADYAAAHSEVAAGDYAIVAVSDTGHGMTPKTAASVFEPFFTTKIDGKGTGLGLAMVFGFVKQSNGHVKIYLEPGEGTTIRIYLPRASSKAAALQRTNVPTDLPRGSATILVVEDEAAVREIAVEILADLGYRVLEGADGDEALRVFGAHAADVDLLLTDVVLPGRIRGRDVAERISSMRPVVKVLYMSGYTENSIVHQGRPDDGIALIGKPFRREQLARRVADLLGAPASAEALDGKVVPIGTRRS